MESIIGYLVLILVVVIFILGCKKMKDASANINSKWFKELDNSKKRKATSLIKQNWKVSIILISFNIGGGLITISTFMGKDGSNDLIVNIAVAIFAAVIGLLLLINNNRLKLELEKEKNN